MCENIKCPYCNSNRINKDGFVNKVFKDIYVEIVKELLQWLKENIVKNIN